MRVHLAADDDQRADRVALVVDGAGRGAEEIAAELEELADQYRGEAVQVLVDTDLAADVVRLLTGSRSPATTLEGDADGWRVST